MSKRAEAAGAAMETRTTEPANAMQGEGPQATAEQEN